MSGAGVRVFFDARLAVRGLGISSASERLTGALVQQDGLTLSLNASARGWNRRGQLETVRRSQLLDLSPRLHTAASSCDVVHYFGNTCPRLANERTVVTVHDLMSMRGTSWKARMFQALLVPGLRRSSKPRIVAISRQTAAGIEDTAPLQRGRVRVVPHGRRDDRSIAAERTHVLMFGGQSDGRKRIGLGLATYAAYADATPDPLPLVIAGRAGLNPAFAGDVVRRGSWHIEEDPSDVRLEALMAQAACLIYPSREEGFGLPVLEAGECGTPVLCAGDGRLPKETHGTHVVHAYGEDAQDWAGMLTRALAMGVVPDAVAHLPTWTEVADVYRDIYEETAT